jgi:hypothetical protein
VNRNKEKEKKVLSLAPPSEEKLAAREIFEEFIDSERTAE